MKLFLVLALSTCFAFPSIAKNIDTIHVEPNTLDLKHLQTGDLSYIQYVKKTKDAPANRVTLINFNIEAKPYNNEPAFVIKQQWESDTVTHKCFTIFDAKSFATVLHETYWRRLGYSMKFDFDTRKVEFTDVNHKGEVPDSIKATAIKDFNQSFDKYNLNWHADMIIYSLLPYKEGRVFVINYYDPGFGKAEEVNYTVTGSNVLTGSNGEKIDCWVLNNYNDDKDPGKGYERFWIAKKSHEVLKLENYGGGGNGYRYKLKLGVSGDK